MLMKHYVELYEWFWNIKNIQNHELWDSIVELYYSRVNESVAESFFVQRFFAVKEMLRNKLNKLNLLQKRKNHLFKWRVWKADFV